MNNKKENDKKIYIIFFTVMAVLYGAGCLIGQLVAKGEKSGDLEAFLVSMKNILTVAIPPLFVLLASVSLIVLLIFYLSCQKMYRGLQADLSDDDLLDLFEYKLNAPLIVVNVMQIVSLFFFGCIIYIAEFASYGRDGGFETVVVITDVVFFVLIFVAGMLVPKGIVEMEKKMNPEKRGNVFDFKFQEVWLSSCDEAQKLIAYRAAYHAFRNTNIACCVLWTLTFIGIFIFKTGVYPILCVCLIWLINSLSYMLKAAELEKGK